VPKQARTECSISPHLTTTGSTTFRRDDDVTGARDQTVSSDGPRPVSHGMTRVELFRLWKDTVRENELPVPNPTSALDGALKIRYDLANTLFVNDRRNGRRTIHHGPTHTKASPR